MAIDQVLALIIETDIKDVQTILVPALKKLDHATAPGKGKAKDESGPSSSTTAAASSSSSTADPAALPAAAVLTELTSEGQDPLELLDPSQHTVGYLYILCARLVYPPVDVQALLPRVLGWVRTFDPPQARLVPDQVALLMQRLETIAQEANDGSIFIEPCKILLQRWAPRGTLTTFHSSFVRFVVDARAYESARPVIDIDITDVDKSTFPVKYLDHLIYHYLAGTIAAVLGDYVRASDLLEICVSAPGPAVSLIQLDAYKKLVLVQLVAFGKTLPLPKYTTSAAHTAFKALSGPYTEFVTAFATHDKANLIASREKHRESFITDHNLGLVVLVEQSLHVRIIQKLTQTWSTLSLSKLTKMLKMDPTDSTQLEQVENQLLTMVQNGQLFATIEPAASTPADKVVRFQQDPQAYLDHATIQRVTLAIERTKQLQQGWDQEGETIESSKEFVSKVHQLMSAGGGGSSIGMPSSIMSGTGDGAGGAFSDEFDYGSTTGFGSTGGGGQHRFARAGGSGIEFVEDDRGYEKEGSQDEVEDDDVDVESDFDRDA
ncbi:uncharacterized protein JCM15063_002004 [Sporobolomyces koalae]|uniref:uncharacterized protein n=1 Tax=Sporobolomyces koalae TaxID=500713 RepID=UPI00317D6816